MTLYVKDARMNTLGNLSPKDVADVFLINKETGEKIPLGVLKPIEISVKVDDTNE